ncbi:Neugrin-domain-containing protein [Gigaspora margarita]|uniref:Required for respiratory growth protein 9, mitochondrial n=1 Tax=Gigaspora margarita TaxID=4874 RepID=A0A8H4A0H1_GIGMA|nr:Neugrin-domain-containing protein [Gigaspora margarita]
MSAKLASRLLSTRDARSILKAGPRDFLRGPTNAKNAIERIKNKKIKQERLLAKKQEKNVKSFNWRIKAAGDHREKIKSIQKSKEKPLSKYLEFIFKKNASEEYPSITPRLIENPKTFFDYVNNQNVLHNGSKLSRRAFLLNMINKRNRPPILNTGSPSSSQKEVKRVKSINLEKLWENENAFPKDYDPNWRDRENLPNWLKHKYAIQERTMFQKWCPRKRVSREVMDNIRLLYNQSPEENNPKKLSQQFKISPESVRRILHSKFIPTAEITTRQNQKLLDNFLKFKAERKAKSKEKKKLMKLKKKKRSKDVFSAIEKPKQKRDRFLKVLKAVQKVSNV